MIRHSAPSLGPEEQAAAVRVLESGDLAQGAEVAAFEEECAAFTGRRHGVAVNSGTSALHLALNVLGVAPGTTVAIPSYACAALTTAVTLQLARPLLCESLPGGNLDPAGVPADVPVIAAHLFGEPAPLPPNPLLVEDIAQSLGGDTGRTGIVAVASFYATKLITTGEGGMLLTDDEGLAEAARDRRDYDNRDTFVPRFSYKLTDLQAAIGREQLRKLPGFIARRRELAERYTRAWAGLPLVLPEIGEGHACFRYVVRTQRREALEKHLTETGIEAKRPVHHPAHHDFGGDFPIAEQLHHTALSVPLYPTLTDAEAARVIEAVARFFDGD